MRLQVEFLFSIILVFLIQSCGHTNDEVWVISAPAGESLYVYEGRGSVGDDRPYVRRNTRSR